MLARFEPLGERELSGAELVREPREAARTEVTRLADDPRGDHTIGRRDHDRGGRRREQRDDSEDRQEEASRRQGADGLTRSWAWSRLKASSSANLQRLAVLSRRGEGGFGAPSQQS